MGRNWEHLSGCQRWSSGQPRQELFYLVTSPAAIGHKCVHAGAFQPATSSFPEKEWLPKDLIAWNSVISFPFIFSFWDNLNLTESCPTSRESSCEPLPYLPGKLASSVTTWPLQEPRRFWWQYLSHILVHEGSCAHPDTTPGCHIAWLVTNVWSPLLSDGPFVTSTFLKSQSFDELPMDSPNPVWGQRLKCFPFGRSIRQGMLEPSQGIRIQRTCAVSLYPATNFVHLVIVIHACQTSLL